LSAALPAEPGNARENFTPQNAPAMFPYAVGEYAVGDKKPTPVGKAGSGGVA
jgi:hypothetical protein